MSENLFLPDTSALVAAWEERYPQEIFPGVWQFIDGLGSRFKICEEVRNEVDHYAPNLLIWLRASYVNSQLSLQRLGDEMSDEVQRHIQRIANGWPNWWAVRSGNSADPWVIAYARAFGGVVISEEQRSGRDVRIPDDCNELDVQHMNLLDLFRAEGFGRVQRNP